jgi:hypothetical protein
VNSVCEPQFWFDRLIRTAIANSIACNCPIRFQTGGDRQRIPTGHSSLLALQSRPAPSYVPGIRS